MVEWPAACDLLARAVQRPTAASEFCWVTIVAPPRGSGSIPPGWDFVCLLQAGKPSESGQNRADLSAPSGGGFVSLCLSVPGVSTLPFDQHARAPHLHDNDDVVQHLNVPSFMPRYHIDTGHINITFKDVNPDKDVLAGGGSFMSNLPQGQVGIYRSGHATSAN